MPITSSTTRIEGLSSWIVYRHGFFPLRSRRYFTLSSQVLSCHLAPDATSKWAIDLPGASIAGTQQTLRITVRAKGSSLKLYFDTEHAFSNWLTALQTSASRRIHDQYEFGPSIGAGAYGQVIKAVDKCTLEQCAIKLIDKIHDDPTDEQYILRELNCMARISHPNVVRTQNIFDTRDRLFLVLEYMPGGSLKQVLARYDRFSEAQTKSIVRDILQGTSYLHEMTIVHRDLKMENVLCTAMEFPFIAKIADFGLANFLGSVTISKAGLKSQVGSPHYIAPEILREERYGPLVDSWSIGVMMYVMLTKKYPFSGRTIQETLQQIVVGYVSFDAPEWKHISREAKDLLSSLLCEDTSGRISPQEALADPWFYTWTDKKHMRRSGRISESCCPCKCNHY